MSWNDKDVDAVHKYEELIEHPELLEHEQPNFIDKFVKSIGAVICWGAVILILVIILQVVLRYGFRHGLIVLEELQWHLYAIGVMFGLSYAQVTESHVRVDIVLGKLSERKQRWIEVLGILFLLLPFCWVVLSNSIDFVADSWRVDESSDAPLGLCCRWAVKAVIPASFTLLILAAFSRLTHNVDQLFGTRITAVTAPVAVIGATAVFIWLLWPNFGEIAIRINEQVLQPLLASLNGASVN